MDGMRCLPVPLQDVHVKRRAAIVNLRTRAGRSSERGALKNQGIESFHGKDRVASGRPALVRCRARFSRSGAAKEDRVDEAESRAYYLLPLLDLSYEVNHEVFVSRS